MKSLTYLILQATSIFLKKKNSNLKLILIKKKEQEILKDQRLRELNFGQFEGILSLLKILLRKKKLIIALRETLSSTKQKGA
jgi:hypothetical protein